MEAHNLSKKFKREKPYKKWTEEEINKILNYLEDAPQLEAPTAQIFYKKCVEKTGIDTRWELIRYKVRHLKASFKKANDWRKSTGAGLLESDAGTSSVEGKVLQMCPHYNTLNKIFGERNVNGDIVVVDSGSMQMDPLVDLLEETPLSISQENFSTSSPTTIPNSPASEKSSPADVLSEQSPPNFVLSEAKTFVEKIRKNAGLLESDAGTSSVEGKVLQMCPHYNTLNKIFGERNVNGDIVVVDSGSMQMDPLGLSEQSPPNCVLSEAKTFAEKIRKNAPKSSAANLAAFQAERTEMQKMRLEWEKEKHEKEMALSERKLKLEEEKMKSEMNLKILQLEQEERLKILEIEKNERLQRYEIEMKYKCQSQK